MSKPLCKYGASCYRKNADHLKRFSHPSGELEKAECAPDTKRRKLSKDVDPLPDHLPPTTSKKEGAMRYFCTLTGYMPFCNVALAAVLVMAKRRCPVQVWKIAEGGMQ